LWRLFGLRSDRGWRSAILSRTRLLVGWRVLRLEARPPAVAPRRGGMGAGALRRAGIMKGGKQRAAAFQPPWGVWRWACSDGSKGRLEQAPTAHTKKQP